MNIYDYLVEWLTERENSGKSRNQHTVNALNKALQKDFPNEQYNAKKGYRGGKLEICQGDPKVWQSNETIIDIYGYFNNVSMEDATHCIYRNDCSDYRQREQDEKELYDDLAVIEEHIKALRSRASELIQNLPLPESRLRTSKHYWDRPSSETSNKYPHCFKRLQE